MVWQALGAAVLGGAVDNFFDRKSLNDQWSYMEGKGLTPQEIVGSASPGRGSSASSVLGNQAAAAAMQRKQQKFEAAERDKDRAIAMRGQDTQVQTAQLSSGASRYGSDVQAKIAAGKLALERDQFDNITLPDALRRSVTESPSWKRRQIMAQMGVDNMIGTIISARYGVDPMDHERMRELSDSDFRKIVTAIYGLQSNIFAETAGAATVVDNGVSEILGR